MNRVKTETIRVNPTLVPIAERGILPIVSVTFPTHQVYYDNYSSIVTPLILSDEEPAMKLILK